MAELTVPKNTVARVKELTENEMLGFNKFASIKKYEEWHSEMSDDRSHGDCVTAFKACLASIAHQLNKDD